MVTLLRDVLDVVGSDEAIAQRALGQVDAREVREREVVEVEWLRETGQQIDRLATIGLGLVRVVTDEVEVPHDAVTREGLAGPDDLLVRRLALVAFASDALGARLDAEGGPPQPGVSHQPDLGLVHHAREGKDRPGKADLLLVPRAEFLEPRPRRREDVVAECDRPEPWSCADGGPELCQDVIDASSPDVRAEPFGRFAREVVDAERALERAAAHRHDVVRYRERIPPRRVPPCLAA